MKAKFKVAFTLVLAIVLFVTLGTASFAASKKAPKKINYVALGDSGAAGVRAMPGQLPGWEEGSDHGYTDLIAKWLDVMGVLGKFDEKYSISGNTAAQLAVDTARADAQNRLRKAEIVTVTIAANDVLQPLYEYYYAHINDPGGIDPNEAMEAIDAVIDNVENNGDEITANIATVLLNTLNANPNVSIYVMGYYNPLPCLMEINPIYDMVPFVAMINEMIQQAIRFVETYCYPEASIEYIDTLFSINGAVPAATPTGYTYLFGPNLPYYLGYLYADMNVPIADIHLTERGYLRVALSFIRAIEADFNFMHLFQAH